MSQKLTFNKEIQRKVIHIATAAIPIAYYFGVSKDILLPVTIFLAAGFLLADILRLNFALARKYFLGVFSILLREGEKNRGLTGATYLFLGMCASIYLFPKEAAVPALLFVSLADPVAALVGKRFCGNVIFGKTIEGALGFYLTAAAVILIFTDYSWLGLGVALLSAVIEFLPVPLNDNLSIPIVAGYLLMVLG